MILGWTLTSLSLTMSLSIPNPCLRRLSRAHLKRHNLPFSTHLHETKNMDQPSQTKARNIAIVGGGLAGLSATYHLLQKSIDDPNLEMPEITIIDKAKPGLGGASSVAGGLLHPFSPRGKLINLGLEGLEASNSLIDVASEHESSCILREKIYRLALSEKNVMQLTDTSSLYPKYATWLTSEEIQERCGSSSSNLGGIVLSSGCKVIHVPTYLQGLWKACQHMSNGTAIWSIEENASSSSATESKDFWKQRLLQFDTVIFAAGSALFHDSILHKDAIDFPADLVRGQSIEVSVQQNDAVSSSDFRNEATLCGKYVVPLPKQNHVLIGATHEFKPDPLNEQEVVEDLRVKCYNMSPFVWESGNVHKITEGYRVQTTRGKYGRMPIIGKSLYNDLHTNSWLFTGLSSRGLVYHGVYGNALSQAILKGDENEIIDKIPDALWWKDRKTSKLR